MRSLDFARRSEPDLVRPGVKTGECSRVAARLTSECDAARDTPSGKELIIGEQRPLFGLDFDFVDPPRLSEFSIVTLSCGSTVPS
jgi:hypothetical protein